MCFFKAFSPNYIFTPGELRNYPQFSFLPRVRWRFFPQFHFYPGWAEEFSSIFISTPGTRVDIESTPRVWWQTTFPEHCFHYNPVTITILPRVHRFNVLSHHCFPSVRSLFIFWKKKTQKIIQGILQTIMSMNPNPTMKKLKMKYGLFRLTQEHHEKCLKKTFLKYYEPLSKGFKPNKHWTTHLSLGRDHERSTFTFVVDTRRRRDSLDWSTDRNLHRGVLSQIESVTISN